jgi:hypothetical protein
MRATERRAIFAAALLAASVPGAARAADWPMVQGTEAKDAPAVRPIGFIQVTGETIVSDRVEGLTSPALVKFNGERAAFNVFEGGTATSSFAVRRARPGLRGALPGTGARVTYFLLAEFGTAAIARDGPTLTDAAVTISYVPGARFRIGQFKLPTMDEGTEANPVAAEWINGTLTAGTIVNENRVKDGRFDGGASGFRDVGVEVFDTFRQGHLALSYAAMVSNGKRGAVDDDAQKDVSGRTTLSYVFSGADSDPHRQELSLFVWGQRGRRDVEGVSAQRVRSGAGIHLEKEPFRVRTELVYASGAISTGPFPPFPGQPQTMDPYARAIGAYVQARMRVFDKALVGLRYEELHRGIDEPRQLRVFRTLSPMLEYDIVPRVRLQATYERRWLSAPDGSADAKTIAATMGDRASLQATVIF